MKPPLPACERCGLREVRHELERKGMIVRFCDECYWGEIVESKPTASASPRPDEPKSPDS
jgi:hypothetical protein